ncbi:hypothetical protein ASE63_23160 [Bosea sp. Root381]|uniref:hypothetical protein n=1 Tax=Bosea sp. Root381 TaxID=1736524 RepID=UPI0007000F2A|nr:hypothetical protein [Bosea sp. Root381]KRE07147.1 hypothetical protein ASE63_23160 [Bosea sp. Root381]
MAIRALQSARAVGTFLSLAVLTNCQSSPQSSFDSPVFSDETRALEKQLDAEAAALGTAQALMSMPAAWDPTGAASLVTIPAGLAAREAFRRQADARMEAQLAKDQAEFYRRYGLNPDGSPSGRKGPLSVD